MWCLVVVVSFWVVSSWVMIRVPPPWAMRASVRFWIGAGISGVAGFWNPGVCIGRKVMVVVVFLLFRMLFAMLSIDWVVMLEDVDWVLLI